MIVMHVCCLIGKLGKGFLKGLDGRRGGPILHDTRESIKWEMGYFKSEYGFNCCIIY